MKINIKNRLDQLGMSRYELAKRVGVTYPTITSIYNGESSSIKFEILESICRVLKCTPNDIIIPEDRTVQRLMEYYTRLTQYTKNDDAE